MNTPGTPIVSQYDVKKTLAKAAYPIGIIVVVEIAYATLSGMGIQIDKAAMYTVATAGYACVMALVNYFKNRRK